MYHSRDHVSGLRTALRTALRLHLSSGGLAHSRRERNGLAVRGVRDGVSCYDRGHAAAPGGRRGRARGVRGVRRRAAPQDAHLVARDQAVASVREGRDRPDGHGGDQRQPRHVAGAVRGRAQRHGGGDAAGDDGPGDVFAPRAGALPVPHGHLSLRQSRVRSGGGERHCPRGCLFGSGPDAPGLPNPYAGARGGARRAGALHGARLRHGGRESQPGRRAGVVVRRVRLRAPGRRARAAGAPSVRVPRLAGAAVLQRAPVPPRLFGVAGRTRGSGVRGSGAHSELARLLEDRRAGRGARGERGRS